MKKENMSMNLILWRILVKNDRKTDHNDPLDTSNEAGLQET